MSGKASEQSLLFPWQEPPAFGQVIEVAPGVLWARLPLPFRLDHVNIYFIEDRDGWVIFEAGINDAAARDVWETLLSGPLAGMRFTKLIVSHHHPDHIGLAGWLCERLGIPLLTSQTSYLSCANISLSPGALEAKPYHDFYTHHGMDTETAALVGSQGHNYLHMVSPLPITFTRLVAGDTLTIGGRRFEVLSGDGHAPEQIMLHAPAEKLLIAADQVIARITPNVSVWAVEPDGDPLGLYIRSLKALSAGVSDEVLVLPGHQLLFHGLHLRSAQLQEHHRERCALIDTACRERPRSVADLVPILFTRPLDPHQLSFAFSEVHAHVNYMIGRGELQAASSLDGIARVEAV